MLYPVLNQPTLLALFLVLGFVTGFVFDIASVFKFFSKKDKVALFVIDFFSTITAFFLIFFVNLKINFGQLRFFVVLIFFASFSLQRFFSYLLWTKWGSSWYNNHKEKQKNGRKRKKEEKT